jgi:hypothetical protein
MELYYLYNHEDLIEGYRNKEIPVAWKNTAVKRYHVLSLLMDEMGREGKNTYILGPDGKFTNLDEFVDEIIKIATKAKALLRKLNAKVRKDEDVDSELLFDELNKEFKKLPMKIDEWKKLNDYALVANEALSTIMKVARRVLVFGKKVGDKELVNHTIELFKLIRKIYPWAI